MDDERWSYQPESILRLRDWMVEGGGSLRILNSEGCANQVMSGSSKGVMIDVLADRSQWFFDLTKPRGGEAFDLRYWLVCAGMTDGVGYRPPEVTVPGLIDLVDSGRLKRVRVSCVRRRRDEFVRTLRCRGGS